MKQIYEVRPKNSFFKFSLWFVFSLYFVFVTFQVVKEYNFVKNELNHPLFGDQDKLLAVVQIFLFWRLLLNIPSFLSNQALCFISISNQQSAREQWHKNYSLSLAITLENLSHFMWEFTEVLQISRRNYFTVGYWSLIGQRLISWRQNGTVRHNIRRELVVCKEQCVCSHVP